MTVLHNLTEEQIAAMEAVMKAFASGQDQTVEAIYNGHKLVASQTEGRFHLAVVCLD